MNNQELYDRIDSDDSLSDKEKRDAYFSEYDENEPE